MPNRFLRAIAVGSAALGCTLPTTLHADEHEDVFAWVCGSVDLELCESIIIENFSDEIARLFSRAEFLSRQLTALMPPQELERFRELGALSARDRLDDLREVSRTRPMTAAEAYMAEVASMIVVADLARIQARRRNSELARQLQQCSGAATFVCNGLAARLFSLDSDRQELELRMRNIEKWVEEFRALIEETHG